MKTDFANDPSFRPAHLAADGTKLYEPTTNLVLYTYASDTQYHISRYVAASAMENYCKCGITPELLTAILDAMEASVNANKLADVAVLVNNLRYRTRYPVDEDAALRLAMIFFFHPGEDPNKVENAWTARKVALVKEDPAAHAFFTEWGMLNSLTYNELHKGSSPSSSSQREADLQALIPRL
ncbi:hypothetical protein DCC81_12000 [Chitinophaga parva]|uniref:Uncharacterized protein n=1 Tax=Chitinophaga parva TaxID=2169414 RepID=A0A2T7BFH0_9BACT|nr:hypothetical protein [Chitinophaga parva]PUZ25030.1 hypothetical protein DCC81_12000 [Chitinophaga parva]